MKKKFNVFFYIIIAISGILLIYSGYKIYEWTFIDTPNTKKIIKDLESTIEVKEYDKEETIDNDTNNYSTTKLIDIDFDKLKKKNNETVAWLNVKGTNINYPVVQTKDNDYYLNHSFDKSENTNGWIFMDYRNNSDFNNYNTIIYGHNTKNMTMFGTLKNTLDKSWFNNSDNRIIKISSENNNSLWQVFSIYSIKTTNDYIQTYFKNQDEFTDFINLIKKRSIYDFDINVNNNDKILTLSTCHGTGTKLVLHAKLIKIDYK